MKIWANSGDSHLVEPDDLFATSLPTEKDPDGTSETLVPPAPANGTLAPGDT